MGNEMTDERLNMEILAESGVVTGSERPEGVGLTDAECREQLQKALDRRDLVEIQRLHEALGSAASRCCSGEAMGVALEDGDDVFVLWHLTHCRSKPPKWLTSVAIACGRVAVLMHLLSRGTALVSSGPRGVI
ncbi:hypothetical protein Poli38472_013430 [Pythium oligandrum]|uniref:Uncharacterized protein n=1 Tax=Pythium oligandrum TaxID=41045 RepID=A0A8K1C7R7_PYTOL|nr:hypothetical protein Poli38472_013430 [Pythium oligandrum]|eukprot:TMW57956.1 hypothetical protein Poli38472_013430 [Pythium oligandrum]